MYLKRLEMYGFKSFAEKTVLEFIPGITTVIGPNGSGKSNISDCIRWILGEQSIKNLRGNKSEDIIFSGTQNRKALGYAEGSLIFDNSDGKLPIEYSEVTVTRKIYRSGETGYFINKTPCRLKDIVELFLDTGIGKDGYSIIGQGKIDEILSNKSEDRRHIFEEAAGIVKFRVRKNESEKKLEQTKINLLRINDIIQEIESNIESLKLASEKAKHYLNLREELKGIEVGLFLYNINDFKNKISQVEENEKVYIDQIENAETTIKEYEERRNKIKEQINFLIDQIEKMQKLSFEGEKKKEQFLSDIGIYQERIANNDSNKQRYEKEIEEIDSKNQDLEDEKKNKISKKTSLKENKDKFEKELKEKEEELAKYAATLSTKALEIENKKSIVEKNIDTKFELGNQLSTEKANLENFEKLHKSIQSDLSDIISELDKANERRAELENGFIVAEKEKNTLLSKVEAMSLERNKSEELISQYDKDIINKESELRLKQTRRDFLIETEKEKEGYAKSVKLLLNEIENDKQYSHGVHGTLGDLISVNEKYQIAIEIALGGSIQNIVTDSENVDISQWTFLPDLISNYYAKHGINFVNSVEISNFNYNHNNDVYTYQMYYIDGEAYRSGFKITEMDEDYYEKTADEEKRKKRYTSEDDAVKEIKLNGFDRSFVFSSSYGSDRHAKLVVKSGDSFYLIETAINYRKGDKNEEMTNNLINICNQIFAKIDK